MLSFTIDVEKATISRVPAFTIHYADGENKYSVSYPPNNKFKRSHISKGAKFVQGSLTGKFTVLPVDMRQNTELYNLFVNQIYLISRTMFSVDSEKHTVCVNLNDKEFVAMLSLNTFVIRYAMQTIEQQRAMLCSFAQQYETLKTQYDDLNSRNEIRDIIKGQLEGKKRKFTGDEPPQKYARYE